MRIGFLNSTAIQSDIHGGIKLEVEEGVRHFPSDIGRSIFFSSMHHNDVNKNCEKGFVRNPSIQNVSHRYPY